MAIANKTKKSAAPVKYTIDCSLPVADSIFDMSSFEKFLMDRIKVAGRTNNLGSEVTVSKAAGIMSVTVANNIISKRYLKYLSKKFLKKTQIREWMRVVAVTKTSYKLKYLNAAAMQDAEE